MDCHLEGESNLVPELIGRLALKLHNQRGENLSIESCEIAQMDCRSQSDLWDIQGGQLLFSSLSARNHCAALQFYRDNIERSGEVSEAAAFDLAHELLRHEIGHADLAAGRFLALARDRFNVLEVAARLIDSGEQEVFHVLHVVEATLKHLPAITVDELCAITVAQHPRTERDLASGMLFRVIEDVLADRPELAWQLYRHLMSAIADPTLNLATSALMALAKAEQVDEVLNRVLADGGADNILLAQAALWTIARLLDAYDLPTAAQARCVEALRKGLGHAADNVKRAAMRSIGLAARRHEALRDDLIDLGKTADREALAVVVHHLFMNSEAVGQYDQLPEFLDVLINVPLDLGRCVDDIDLIISQLLKGGYSVDLLLQFLTAWVTRHGSPKIREEESIERFDQTVMAIVERPVLLQRLITEWLIADAPQLISACSGLISFLWVRGVRDLSFLGEILDDMQSAALIHLVRRMLGFVYSEEPLLSLTFSLLDTREAPTRTYPIVRTLLVREVGRNYVENTLQAIAKRMEAASGPLKALLKSAHDELTSYQKAIDDLPVLQELRGPLQLRRAIALRKAADMRKTMDAADDRSVFLRLVKQVPVKAGIGCFSVKDGKVSETTRFGSFSHSVSLPRQYIADPVGYAIEGLLYRLSKRGDE